MNRIFEILRSIFFTKIVGDIDLYTILSSLFKYIFVFIVLYFIYLIVKLIFLDIKTSYSDSKFKKSYLDLLSSGEGEENAIELFEMGEFTSIGRDFDNDLILEDSLVSRRHAIIIWKNDGFYLEDMKSSNGTYLNGERIFEVRKLEDEDVLSFGAYQYRFKRGEEQDV
ncbi:MAG: FHA domain-containing protein [Tissierellia bacterium]|nr:FHA domain-containing protein [Tissierellia bacterium]